MLGLIRFGRKLNNSAPALLPYNTILRGRYVNMLPLEADKHYKSLFENINKTAGLFDFLVQKEETSADQYMQRLKSYEQDNTKLHFAIELANSPGDCVGLICLADADPKNKKVLMGRASFSYKLQGTPASNESFYLLLNHVFEDLGYNKVRGIVNNLNLKCIKKIERFGFVREGTLREEIVIDGFAIDGQLFSLLERDWSAAKKSIEAWRDLTNFDSRGKQIRSLAEIQQSL